MNAGRRSTTILTAIAVLTTVVGCSDQLAPNAPSRPAPNNPSAEIWDGANGINGNTDVFFLPPMVSNPNGRPGYGDAFQPGLPVAFKIRDMNTGSVIREFSPASVATSLSDQHYKVNWDTKADNLNVTHTYRIEAWIGSKKIAFADVDVVSSGSQLKNVNTDEFIPLLDDRTLPIKIRVEKGWNCKNDASCASQLVTNTPPAGAKYTIVTTNDGENAVAFPANWFDPAVAPNGVLVTVEDVTQELSLDRGGLGCGLGLTVMVLEQQCIRITTDPVVTVTNPVIVGACLSDNADHRAQLLKIHEGDNPDVTFLRNVPPPIQCPEHIGANPFSNPIARYAYAALSGVGRQVQKVLSPKSAYALDLGVGGEIGLGGGFSIITSGVPLSMAVLAGDQQNGLIGGPTAIDPRVRLRALHRPSLDIPEGPNDAIVTCAVTSGGGTIGGSASAPATHNAENDDDGVYTCPTWTLGEGTNTLRVSAANVDDVVRLGGVAAPFTGSVTFTAFGVPSLTLDFEAFSGSSASPRCDANSCQVTNQYAGQGVTFSFVKPSYTDFDPPAFVSIARTFVLSTDGAANHVVTGPTVNGTSYTGSMIMTPTGVAHTAEFDLRYNGDLLPDQTRPSLLIEVRDVTGELIEGAVTRVSDVFPTPGCSDACIEWKHDRVTVTSSARIGSIKIVGEIRSIFLDNLTIQ